MHSGLPKCFRKLMICSDLSCYLFQHGRGDAEGVLGKNSESRHPFDCFRISQGFKLFQDSLMVCLLWHDTLSIADQLRGRERFSSPLTGSTIFADVLRLSA